MTSLYPLRLSPSPRERIWGTTDLRPYFGEFAEPVGEIWYAFEANHVTNGPESGRTLGSLMTEYGERLMGAAHQPRDLVRRSAGAGGRDDSAPRGPYFPILTKMLFAAKTLSVQVHPDDRYAMTGLVVVGLEAALRAGARAGRTRRMDAGGSLFSAPRASPPRGRDQRSTAARASVVARGSTARGLGRRDGRGRSGERARPLLRSALIRRMPGRCGNCLPQLPAAVALVAHGAGRRPVLERVDAQYYPAFGARHRKYAAKRKGNGV